MWFKKIVEFFSPKPDPQPEVKVEPVIEKEAVKPATKTRKGRPKKTTKK